MSSGASTAPWRAPRTEAGMRRVTWAAVAVAIAIWLVLTLAGARWAASSLYQWTAAAPTVVERLGGVALYREADGRAEVSAREGMLVFDGDELATSFGSLATLRTFDGALIDLYPNARLRVDAAGIGRVNRDATRLTMTLVGGAARLSIPHMADKRHTVNVASPHGAAAFVPGEYTLRVGPDGTRISVWEGRIAAAVGGEIVEINPGQKIILWADRSQYTVTDVLENVLPNSDFAQGAERWEGWEEREQGRADVPGRWEIVAPSGPGAPAHALRVWRTSQVDAHNETGLRQGLGRDVSGARQISIRGSVKIDGASLSGGGYLGSEYPIMVRVRFRDSRGVEQAWTQGFYYANPENRPTPIGVRVERGVWTPFEADLTGLFGPMSAIETLEAFGSGHTFDASIGAIALLVD